MAVWFLAPSLRTLVHLHTHGEGEDAGACLYTHGQSHEGGRRSPTSVTDREDLPGSFGV
jgi:hypothetical protein